MSCRLWKVWIRMTSICQSHQLPLLLTPERLKWLKWWDTHSWHRLSTVEKNTGIESLTGFVLVSRVSIHRSQGWDAEMNRTRKRYDNDDSKNNTGIIEVINRCKHIHRSLSLALFSSWQASKRTPNTRRHFHNSGEIFMCESVFIYIFKWVWQTSRAPADRVKLCWPKWLTLNE